MKKIILITLASLAMGSVQAQPQSWISKNPNDVITVNYPNDNKNHSVEIFTNLHNPMGYKRYHATGIILKNCQNLLGMSAGSGAVCELNEKNPVVTFSSDKDMENDRAIASGTYEIQ